MSYSTDYTLDIRMLNDENDLKEEMKKIKEFADSLEDSELKNILEENYLWDESWYEHDVDMLYLSAQFPNVIFSLEGYGEEHDDHWEIEYCQGKVVNYYKTELVSVFGDEENRKSVLESTYSNVLSDIGNLFYLEEVLVNDKHSVNSAGITKYIDELERWLAK